MSQTLQKGWIQSSTFQWSSRCDKTAVSERMSICACIFMCVLSVLTNCPHRCLSQVVGPGAGHVDCGPAFACHPGSIQ